MSDVSAVSASLDVCPSTTTNTRCARQTHLVLTHSNNSNSPLTQSVDIENQHQEHMKNKNDMCPCHTQVFKYVCVWFLTLGPFASLQYCLMTSRQHPSIASTMSV